MKFHEFFSHSVAVSYEKRFKKERRARRRLQEKLDLESKKLAQLEDAFKATGATADQVRAITGKKKKATNNFKSVYNAINKLLTI